MRQPNSGRRLTAVLMAVWLAGCSTWQVVAEPPGPMITREGPSSVRVGTRDGAMATVREPRITSDSLRSAVDPGVGYALQDVERIWVRRLSPSRTLGLAGAGLVAASLWTTSVVGTGGGSDGSDPVPKLSPNLFSGLAWLGRLVLGN